MRSYSLSGLSVQKNYKIFIRYMSAYSNAFSLVYFRYKEDEKIRRTVRSIQKKLSPYIIKSKRFKGLAKLPSMLTANQFHHIYELTLYKTCFETIDVLESVHSIRDWDYPKRPMDLSFYQNGYAWFTSSAHEDCNVLYTDDPHIIQDLIDIGINVVEKDDVDCASLFYESSLS